MMWGSGMGWAWLFGILLIVGVAVLVTVLVMTLTGRSRLAEQSRGHDAPAEGLGRRQAVDILEQRYARGEINTEEFQERLRGLQEGDR